MERLCPDVKRDDVTTQTSKNLPLNTRGLIQNYNVGFQPFTVDVHMMLFPLFMRLYGTDKLRSSFDGVSFTRKRKADFASLADWKERCMAENPVHIDQTTPGELSIQSGVAITDQEEDMHTFLCIPGSHKDEHHRRLLKIWHECAYRDWQVKHKAWKDALDAGTPLKTKFGNDAKEPEVNKGEPDWQVMRPEQLAYLREHGLEMKRIPMKKGDVVLWRSNLVHASAPYCKTAPKDAMRLQIFVCMKPIPDDPVRNAKDMERRREAYDEGRVSRHSADWISLFGKKPHIYGPDGNATHQKMRTPRSLKMTRAEKRLYGLIPYE
jgi:hypothetical protein